MIITDATLAPQPQDPSLEQRTKKAPPPRDEGTDDIFNNITNSLSQFTPSDAATASFAHRVITNTPAVSAAKSTQSILSEGNSTSEELGRATVKSTPAFVMNDRLSHPAAKYAPLATLAFIFPLLLYEAVRVLLQRLIMIFLYPAQSGCLKKMYKDLDPNELNKFRVQNGKEFEKLGYFLKEVTLERNGVRYDGLMIGKKDAIENGNWILQASGNRLPIEDSVHCSQIYAQAGFNTLLINGPSVGRSEGHATPQSMGEAQETGLQFLETTIKAQKIALAGYSLGGAMMGQAIIQHEFQKDVKYLVIQQATFDRTSNIVKQKMPPILNKLAEQLIHWTGLEMDNVEASRKLADLGINEVIIQASDQVPQDEAKISKNNFKTDGVIPAQGSLGYSLVEGGLPNKIYKLFPLKHGDMDTLFLITMNALRQKYFNSPNL